MPQSVSPVDLAQRGVIPRKQFYIKLFFFNTVILVPCADGARSHARQELSSLEAWLSAPSTLQLPLHQIERQQQTKGREVQRLLLQAHLQRRGHGDMGPALCVRQGDDEVLYTHRRLSTRSLKTVFGTIEIVRVGYSRAATNSICPLDAALALPARVFSYELQRRLVQATRATPSV